MWWLGKASRLTTTADTYIVRHLDDPGPVEIALTPSRYTTAHVVVRGRIVAPSRTSQPLFHAWPALQRQQTPRRTGTSAVNANATRLQTTAAAQILGCKHAGDSSVCCVCSAHFSLCVVFVLGCFRLPPYFLWPHLTQGAGVTSRLIFLSTSSFSVTHEWKVTYQPPLHVSHLTFCSNRRA